jgi:hypothetical protein
MAKDYKKGASYVLNFDTASSWASPTWVTIKACGDLGCDPNPDDVVIPERGSDTGHLNGEKDPSFTFNLFEDAGDTNVETLIAAIYSGAMVHLALSRGPIATAGTKWVHMECVLRAPLGAARPDPSAYDVTAYRHANSDNNLTRVTTPS